MRASYATPEGMPERDPREEGHEAGRPEFERQRYERYERCLQSLRGAYDLIGRAASR